jgi:hypothetical protein
MFFKCLLLLPYSRKSPKSFAFDKCFSWQAGTGDQELVFQSLGTDILDNAFKVEHQISVEHIQDTALRFDNDWSATCSGENILFAGEGSVYRING